jgi:hypothetical protein
MKHIRIAKKWGSEGRIGKTNKGGEYNQSILYACMEIP